ncbi:mycofactocin-coupled SDR family oxidoreductase [Petropleomorpha daqingensis]|uniref:SDR family mycofactocin-dependent oxidoreductase n=1 Tax=Petropleomorpha daqingensis TaxID=2026353 RepID=A0A853CRC1_9ACTN|nr:SDR family mycofactocin-dependent oxidoreductase [Petropleomorpha daqingensis]
MTGRLRTGRLAGKVAFVTGAARGQGRSHCVRMAAEGADVVAFDLCGPVERRDYIRPSTPDDLEETARLVEKAGGRIVRVQGDVRSADDLARARDAGIQEFGGIDVVVANAGTGGAGKLTHELDEAEWAVTLGINLTGVWLTAKTFLPHLVERGGGSLVLIGSAAAVKAVPHLVDYVCAKAGVVALTKVLANEYGPHGVRANCVCPGNVATDLVVNDEVLRMFRPDLDRPTVDDAAPVLSSMVPLAGQPLLQPGDVSEAVLWLASDEARWVTGAVLAVDMGMTSL